jgi:AAA domain
MSRVLVGQQIIGSVLDAGTAQPYLDKGWTLDWVTDRARPEYAALFRGNESDVYAHILRYQARHGVVPTIDLLEYEFTEVKLPVTQLRVSEILELAQKQLGQVQLAWNDQEILALREEGRVQEAAELMLESAQKVLRSASRSGIRDVFDRADFDITDWVSRRIPRGPGFGISELDDHWPGAQPGQLLTLVGRAKAGKSNFLIASAYEAWYGHEVMRGARGGVDPKRVLFLTFEMGADIIKTRLMCYGAQVNPEKFLAPVDDDPPSQAHQQKLIRFWEDKIQPEDSQSLMVVQPTGRYTISELEMDIEAFEADVVYVDGFYFMVDEQSGFSGLHPTGHDNLAQDLKSLSLRRMVSLWVTHQFREKQLGKAGGGIKDDSAMASGTGLRMASDVLATLDKDLDSGAVTWTNTANRGKYLPTVKGEWNWDAYRFEAYVDETTDDWEAS